MAADCDRDTSILQKPFFASYNSLFASSCASQHLLKERSEMLHFLGDLFIYIEAFKFPLLIELSQKYSFTPSECLLECSSKLRTASRHRRPELDNWRPGNNTKVTFRVIGVILWGRPLSLQDLDGIAWSVQWNDIVLQIKQRWMKIKVPDGVYALKKLQAMVVGDSEMSEVYFPWMTRQDCCTLQSTWLSLGLKDGGSSLLFHPKLIE